MITVIEKKMMANESFNKSRKLGSPDSRGRIHRKEWKKDIHQNRGAQIEEVQKNP